MTPAKVDLNLIQGATYRRAFRVRADLTGVTGRMQLRDRIGGALLATLDAANGGLTITPGAETSEGLILIAKTITATLTVDSVYDVFFDYLDGSSQMVIYGRGVLHKRVTE